MDSLNEIQRFSGRPTRNYSDGQMPYEVGCPNLSPLLPVQNIKQEAYRTAKSSCMLKSAAVTKPLASQFQGDMYNSGITTEASSTSFTASEQSRASINIFSPEQSSASFMLGSRENMSQSQSGMFRGIRMNTREDMRLPGQINFDGEGAERVGRAVARIQSAIVLGEKDKAFLDDLFSDMPTTAGTTNASSLEPSAQPSLIPSSTPSAMNSSGNLLDGDAQPPELTEEEKKQKQEEMEKKFAEFEKKKEVHSMKKAALKRFKQLMRRGNASEPMAGAVAISREPVNKLNLVTKSPRTQSSGNKQRHVWSRPSYTEVLPMFTPEDASVKAGQQSTMCSIM